MAGVLVAASALGILLALSMGDADDATAGRRSSQIQAWCADVDHALGPDAPVHSFRGIVRLAFAGRLARPATDPPLHDDAGLRRWQQANRAYLTSTYLANLEDPPGEIGYATAALRIGLESAHQSKPIEIPDAVRTFAKALDRYRRQHC